MFELSVARKYLTPRWRQLSVSIISLISILVIALVVWLIVVFFSVTSGLEKSWISKLITLTAPVRITPTDAYYRSYYYQADSISAASNYAPKSISEKLKAAKTDPYDPLMDEEPPANWTPPDLDSEGKLKDPVKLAFQAIAALSDIPGLQASDFEMTVSNMKIQLLRQALMPGQLHPSLTQATMGQTTYLGSFDANNPAMLKTTVPLSMQDINNVFYLNGIATNPVADGDDEMSETVPRDVLRSRLKTFFQWVTVHELTTPASSWKLPKHLYPDHARLEGIGLYKQGRLLRFVIPADANHRTPLQMQWKKEGFDAQSLSLVFRDRKAMLIQDNQEKALPVGVTIAVAGGVPFQTTAVQQASIEKARQIDDLLFDVKFDLQGIPFQGSVHPDGLEISQADITTAFPETPERPPLWLYSQQQSQGSDKLILPSDPLLGDGVLLPRVFREAGILVGDRGYLNYMTPTASSMQEQRIPIFVVGFYDPGVIPIGGKYVLANQEITALIRSAHNQEDTSLSNGINIRFDNLDQADHVKAELQKAFEAAGIAPYWKIETFREYDFTKDLIQQLRSEKNLFTLLATIIIIVACSNIISMLIILVNDKKTEIGILRSMGATSGSIAAIFGVCGIIMGVVGSVIGTLAAVVTLKNLQGLVAFLSNLQGYEMFNPLFFGETLPTDLSFEALSFVILATGLISLVAGLVPALKASLMRPSAILRAE